jgi:hypothetical protein
MAMQPVCEIPKQRVVGIGGNGVDDQPMPGHPERYRLTGLQQERQPADEPVRGIHEVRMPSRVHGALVEDDRELD